MDKTWANSSPISLSIWKILMFWITSTSHADRCSGQKRGEPVSWIQLGTLISSKLRLLRPRLFLSSRSISILNYSTFLIYSAQLPSLFSLFLFEFFKHWIKKIYQTRLIFIELNFELISFFLFTKYWLWVLQWCLDWSKLVPPLFQIQRKYQWIMILAKVLRIILKRKYSNLPWKWT